MRLVSLLFLFVFTACATPRISVEQITTEATAYQTDLSAKYLDPARTILPPKKLKILQEKDGLPFYPIATDYRVVAKVERFTDPEVIEMKTSSTRMAAYEVYALATFKMKGATHSLTLYKSRRTDLAPKYQQLLFLPFKDATSGNATYGGGRYLDLPIPEGNTIVIDFNKAYHPYCAYTTGYSCPVVPTANHLDIPIEAGIKSIDLGGY